MRFKKVEKGEESNNAKSTMVPQDCLLFYCFFVFCCLGLPVAYKALEEQG